MQLQRASEVRTQGTIDLHAPARIHAPPMLPTVRPERLRVAAATPRTPGQSHGPMQVTALVRRPDGSTGDAFADAALRTALVVDGVLSTRFGRDGIDGRGGTVELVVHAPDSRNAYWDKAARRVELGDGDGTEWGAFGESLSVMAHELYHGVIDAEVQLDYEQAEQAALHESFADVFAAGVVGSWRIGEDVMTPGVAGDAIRDLARPAIGSMADAHRAGGESHALSGVASLAAVRASEAIGLQDLQRLWYRALVDHLPDGAGFAGAAMATVHAAVALYGEGSSQASAVAQAWASVGVLAAT